MSLGKWNIIICLLAHCDERNESDIIVQQELSEFAASLLVIIKYGARQFPH